MVKNITDQNFTTETNEGLVLVDFWAPWCGPCRIQGPIIDELAKEMSNVTFTKMDVDENPQTASEFGIMAIPTLIVKKDGELVQTLQGVHRKEQLVAVLNQYV